MGQGHTAATAAAYASSSRRMDGLRESPPGSAISAGDSALERCGAGDGRARHHDRRPRGGGGQLRRAGFCRLAGQRDRFLVQLALRASPVTCYFPRWSGHTSSAPQAAAARDRQSLGEVLAHLAHPRLAPRLSGVRTRDGSGAGARSRRPAWLRASISGTEQGQEAGLMIAGTEPGGFADAPGGTLVCKPSLPSMHAGQGESWNH
jgi:hypothetical protein